MSEAEEELKCAFIIMYFGRIWHVTSRAERERIASLGHVLTH